VADGKNPAFSVLLVDDEAPWLLSLSMILESQCGITNILQCQDSRLVMQFIEQHNVGVILLDLTMPFVSGDELLQKINEHYPDIKIIVVTALNQVEVAVDCMRKGAFDFFVKTTPEEHLITAVRHAIHLLELQHAQSEIEKRLLSDVLEYPELFSAFVTVNKKMFSIFQYAEAVAKSKHPLLIMGESGVGKELIARAVHSVGRKNSPLISINLAGVDDTVFSDTLFGHVRGAFTGAEEIRSGLLEEAADGTLFLDEIGDLPPTSQIKLLRLLQENEYYPVGGDKPKQSRARIISATNYDLHKKVEKGEFRRDLFYRLKTHCVHIPPLRERKEDIPYLLDVFLEEAAKEFGKKKPTVPKELSILLSNYHFPGNVRELRAMVFDAVSTHRSKMLSMESFIVAMGLTRKEDLPALSAADSDDSAEKNVFSAVEVLPSLRNVEKLLIEEAMRRAGGVQGIAARLLGVSSPALSKRLRAVRLSQEDTKEH